jgi:hypothetical protein
VQIAEIEGEFSHGGFVPIDSPDHSSFDWFVHCCAILADIQKGWICACTELPDAHTVCESRYFSLAGFFRLAGSEEIKAATDSSYAMTFPNTDQFHGSRSRARCYREIERPVREHRPFVFIQIERAS